MAIDRWDPFRDAWSLRDAMDRLFQENFIRPTSALLTGGRGYLPIDVIESDNNYVVHATLPGIRPEDVQITVTGDTVTIRGESRAEEEAKPGQNWIVRERRSSSVYRSVTLPSPVNADRAEARYEHGTLTLTLPKSEEARPKQIRITSTAAPTVASGNGAGASTTSGIQGAPAQTDTGAAAGQQTGSQTSASMVSSSPSTATGIDTGAQQDQDVVGDASADSFPASDPPSYTSHSV